jgi:hypothetical protein
MSAPVECKRGREITSELGSSTAVNPQAVHRDKRMRVEKMALVAIESTAASVVVADKLRGGLHGKFSDLPNELVGKISEFLDLEDGRDLSEVSKAFKSTVQPKLPFLAARDGEAESVPFSIIMELNPEVSKSLNPEEYSALINSTLVHKQGEVGGPLGVREILTFSAGQIEAITKINFTRAFSDEGASNLISRFSEMENLESLYVSTYFDCFSLLDDKSLKLKKIDFALNLNDVIPEQLNKNINLLRNLIEKSPDLEELNFTPFLAVDDEIFDDLEFVESLFRDYPTLCNLKAMKINPSAVSSRCINVFLNNCMLEKLDLTASCDDFDYDSLGECRLQSALKELTISASEDSSLLNDFLEKVPVVKKLEINVDEISANEDFLTDGSFPSLNSVFLENLEELKFSQIGLTSVETIKNIFALPKLKSLCFNFCDIYRCIDFRSVPSMEGLEELSFIDMRISECVGAHEIPLFGNDGLVFNMLKRSPNLKKFVVEFDYNTLDDAQDGAFFKDLSLSCLEEISINDWKSLKKESLEDMLKNHKNSITSLALTGLRATESELDIPVLSKLWTLKSDSSMLPGSFSFQIFPKAPALTKLFVNESEETIDSHEFNMFYRSLKEVFSLDGEIVAYPEAYYKEWKRKNGFDKPYDEFMDSLPPLLGGRDMRLLEDDLASAAEDVDMTPGEA